jgi:hypothetical protein
MGSDLLDEIRREIDARLGELRPALEEYEQLLQAAGALDAEERPPARRRGAAAKAETSEAIAAPPSTKAPRAARGAAREAILGALEHGSHTLAELVVVTAMSSANVNGNLRKLAAEKAIAKTQREGKTAWMLAPDH